MAHASFEIRKYVAVHKKTRYNQLKYCYESRSNHFLMFNDKGRFIHNITFNFCRPGALNTKLMYSSYFPEEIEI